MYALFDVFYRKKMCCLEIAVAGTGYVGLSIATLPAQNHKVYAVDIIPEDDVADKVYTRDLFRRD